MLTTRGTYLFPKKKAYVVTKNVSVICTCMWRVYLSFDYDGFYIFNEFLRKIAFIIPILMHIFAK